jgi:uncharacterized membrane protein YdjX (TVP38/TMEM64 family)
VLLLLLAGTGFLLGILFRDRIDLPALVAWGRGLGNQGIALYLLLYAVGPAFGAPALPLTLLGGALYGPWLGGALAVTGATIADSLGFLLARYVGAAWLERRATGAIRRVKEGVEAEGWRFIAFLRLTPIFPFGLVSYAMGLTRVPFWVYAVTTFFCILPAASIYAYVGHAGLEVMAEGHFQSFFIAVGCIAAVAFLPLFAKRLRKPSAPS